MAANIPLTRSGLSVRAWGSASSRAPQSSRVEAGAGGAGLILFWRSGTSDLVAGMVGGGW